MLKKYFKTLIWACREIFTYRFDSLLEIIFAGPVLVIMLPFVPIIAAMMVFDDLHPGYRKRRKFNKAAKKYKHLKTVD